MPRGGIRIAGPGKKIGRPKLKKTQRKVTKSITLSPEHWNELRARKPNLSYGAAVVDALERLREYETC